MNNESLTVDQIVKLTTTNLEVFNVTNEDTKQDIYLMMLQQYNSFKDISIEAISNIIKDEIIDMLNISNKKPKIKYKQSKNTYIVSDKGKAEVYELLKAIERLDSVHKFVISKYYGIYSNSEEIEKIAECLGCDIDTTRKIQAEGLEQLKELII